MSQAEAELRVREQETINNLQSVSLTTSRMDTKQQGTISTEVWGKAVFYFSLYTISSRHPIIVYFAAIVTFTALIMHI